MVNDTLERYKAGQLTKAVLQQRRGEWLAAPFHPDVADYFLNGPGRVQSSVLKLLCRIALTYVTVRHARNGANQPLCSQQRIVSVRRPTDGLGCDVSFRQVQTCRGARDGRQWGRELPPPSFVDIVNWCSFITEPPNRTCRRSSDFNGGVGAGGRRATPKDDLTLGWRVLRGRPRLAQGGNNRETSSPSAPDVIIEIYATSNPRADSGQVYS